MIGDFARCVVFSAGWFGRAVVFRRVSSGCVRAWLETEGLQQNKICYDLLLLPLARAARLASTACTTSCSLVGGRSPSGG